MPGAYSLVNSSRTHLANVISKRGRNEIQFYPISASQDFLIDTANVTRHELQEDSDIVAMSWLNESSHTADSPGRPRKRKSEASVLENGHSTQNGNDMPPSSTVLLAVGFSSGEIWIFSPFGSNIVSKFNSPRGVRSITGSSMQNHAWVLTESASIVEINVLDGEITKTINFSKIDTDISQLVSSKFHPKKKRAAQEPEMLVAASSSVYLVDGARSRKHVMAEWANGEKEFIAFTHPFPQESSPFVVISRENSNAIELYDLADPSSAPSLYKTKSTDIRGIGSLADKYFVVFTGDGANVFSLEDYNDGNPVGLVTTGSKARPFENLFYSEHHGVIGVWYDGVQPKFTLVSEDLALENEYEIAIEIKETADEPGEDSVPDITFTAVESEEVHNLAAGELFSELSSRLRNREASTKDVIVLCAANDHADNIKNTIRHLSHADDCSELVERLFEIVATQVAKDPTRATPLSIWLRWVLLTHGGYISKQKRLVPVLRMLQSSLDDGMALMAKLLALQGRLQLLSAQAELRNNVGQEAEDSGDDSQLNETFNNTTTIEESIVYVNGENDDENDDENDIVEDDNFEEVDVVNASGVLQDD